MSDTLVEQRLDLVRRHTAEILTEEDLTAALASGVKLRHYIGFEISGRIHLGTGLICMSKVRDFVQAGFECSIFLADFHSWINDKLGGDLEVIRSTARGYFKETLESCLDLLGVPAGAVTFVFASDFYSSAANYWPTVLEVAKHTSLSRVTRSTDIMGRALGKSVDFAKLIYPVMQVADIFAQGVSIAHAGMDQRKAHVIARDVASRLTIAPLVESTHGVSSPIAIHHPLLMGLGKPPVWPIDPEKVRETLVSMKMSKSAPNTAVFVHDSADEIQQRLKKAFCPPEDVTFNPILNWFSELVFSLGSGTVEVTREARHGGNISFGSYEELCEAYAGGGVHASDLKAYLVDFLVDLLAPVRATYHERNYPSFEQ